MFKLDLRTLKALVAEFICTFIFIFTICGSALDSRYMVANLGSLIPAVCTAFVAVAIIYTFGGLSGAHFNPAVTLGALIGSKIDPIRGVLYIILQLLAGTAAVGMLGFLHPRTKAAEHLLLTPQGTILEAVVMEAILTFILVMVIYGTAMGVKVEAGHTDIETPDEQTELIAANKAKLNFAPIAIGLTLGFLCFLGGRVSGGAFNPARATAPAIIAGKFTDLWIYWVGDASGAIAAAAFYHFFFERS